MKPHIALPAALLLAAAATSQQTKVIPAGMEHLEGPLVYTYPFGRADGAIQVLIDADQITLGQGVITGLNFRPSQVTAAQAGTGYTKNYRITAYVVARAAAQMVADLATNIGGAAGTVVFSGPVSVPSSGVLAVQPAPFAIAMPFSTPLVYDGSQGNLLLHVETADTAAVPGLYRIDAVNFRNNTITGLVADLDPNGGCPGGGVPLTISTLESQVIVGGTIDTTITSGMAGAFPVVLSLLSLDWLPTDLGGFGLPGCTSWLNGFVFQIVLENPAGGYPHALWSIPANPVFEGAALYTQALGLPPSNLLTGAAVSQGQAMRVGSSTFPQQKVMAAFRSSTGWFIGSGGEFAPVMQFDGVFP